MKLVGRNFSFETSRIVARTLSNWRNEAQTLSLTLAFDRWFQDLVPVTEVLSIPYDYHRFIIGAKGANVRQMMDECDVNIAIPPSRDESDQVTIIGTRPKVNRAIEALQQKVAEIEAENEDRVSLLFPA